MNSPDPVQMDVLDLLIARALRSCYGEIGPSPRIWPRIRRRIVALTSQLTPVWEPPHTLHLTHRMDTIFPFPAAGSLVLWRYDFLLPRLA